MGHPQAGISTAPLHRLGEQFQVRIDCFLADPQNLIGLCRLLLRRALLSLTGVKLPAEYFPNVATDAKGKPDTQAVFKRMGELEKTVTEKDAVTRMLTSSLDEVRNRFSQLTPAELDRPTDFFGEQTTVRRVYLRIFAHVNEHYGQSVAYARVNGIVPPWSQTQKPE